MKRFGLSIFVAIIVSILFVHGINNRIVQSGARDWGAFCEDVELLTDTAKYTQADIIGCNINLWAGLSDQYSDIKDLKRITRQVIGSLDCLAGYRTRVVNRDDFCRVVVEGYTNKGIKVDVICQSFKGSVRERRQVEGTYLVVGFYGDGLCDDLREMIQWGYSGFSSFDVIPRASACITCAFDGIISPRDGEDIVDGILAKLGAKKVESVKEDGLLSLSGYTPSFNTYLPAGGNRININIALRYNQWRGKTFLWLGLPVICIPY